MPSRAAPGRRPVAVRALAAPAPCRQVAISPDSRLRPQLTPPPPNQDSAEAKGPLSARPWSALPGTRPGYEGHCSLHPLMVPGTISNLRQELRQAKPVPPLTVDAPSPGSRARAVSGVHAPSAPLFCQKTGCLSSPGPLTCGPDFWSSADQSDLVRTERCAEG